MRHSLLLRLLAALVGLPAVLVSPCFCCGAAYQFIDLYGQPVWPADPWEAALHFALALLTGGCGGFLLWRLFRSALPLPGHCPECDYDLRGRPDSPTCPECGESLSEQPRK